MQMLQAQAPLWRRVFGAAWAALFGAVLVLMSVKLHETAVDGYRMLSPLRLAISLPVVFATFLLAKALMRLHPAFRWKPSDLLFGKRIGAADSSLMVVALRVPVLGPFVALLLLMNLPTIAMLEEFIFRQDTSGWGGAAVRSLLFGLAHLATNVPLGASIAIGGTGLWFSWWYFRGGIALSGAMHLAYILPIVSLVLLGLAIEAWKRRRP